MGASREFSAFKLASKSDRQPQINAAGAGEVAMNQRLPFVRVASLICVALLATVQAKAEVVVLNPMALPSTQGWTYSAGGADSGVAESQVYSIVDGKLRQNSMGIALGPGAHTYYVKSITLGATTDWVFEIVARINAVEFLPGSAYGFFMGVETTSGLPSVGLAANNPVYVGTGFNGLTGVFPSGYVATDFNKYRISATGGTTYSFSVNDIAVFTGQAYTNGTPTRLAFGDGTGGGNASVDIRSLSFRSGADVLGVVPEPATWAIMIFGFGMIGCAMRRRRRQIRSAIA